MKLANVWEKQLVSLPKNMRQSISMINGNSFCK